MFLFSFHDLYHFLNTHDTLVIGATIYAGGLILLNMLEKNRVANGLPSTFFPQLEDRDVLSSFDREIPWITLTTMDSFRSARSLQELSESSVLIGTRMGVSQFVTLKSCKTINGVQELHLSWSELYDKDVFIYKKKIF